MLALIFYVVVAFAIALLWDRLVRPLSVAAIIVMMAMPLCFTGRAMFTGRVFAPADIGFLAPPLEDYARDYGVVVRNTTLTDVYEQMIPWRFAARESIARGEWPLLNQHQLCGSPLAAAMQSAPYDPFRLIAMLLPFAGSVTFGATITLFLAAFFTFTFARELGCSEEASLIAAALYMFCGPLSFFFDVPLGAAFAILPFVLAAVHRASFAMLTLALVLTIVAGHPESIFFIVITGVAYGLTMRLNRRAIGVAIASGVAALALTAIVLLPFVALLDEVVESQSRRQYAMPIANTPQIAIDAGSMFLPFYGREHTSLSNLHPGSVGAIGFALAAVAVALANRRRETLFFAVLALITTLIAWDVPPIADLLRKLPLFNIAMNNRFIFVACFAVAMLAAIGVDVARERAGVSAAIAISVAIALALATWHTWPIQIAAGVRVPMIVTMLVADLVPLACAALLIVLRIPRASIVILALVLLQRTVEEGSIHPTVDPGIFYPRVPIVAAIPRSDEPFRIAGAGDALLPNSATMYGLEDVRGYEVMRNRLFVETYPQWCSQPIRIAFNRVDDLSRPFLSLLNVRYAIATREMKVPNGWRTIAVDRNSVLLENMNAKARAFIERGAGSLVTRRAPNGLSIAATLARDSSITISQVAWNGWHATIDDKPIPLYRTHHALLGIDIPRGAHSIRLVYMPRAFVIGRAISGIAIALLAIVAIIRARR